MKIQDVVLKVKQRVNKKDTQDYDNIPVFEIIKDFNKAQLSVLNRLYGANNNYKQGFEATRKRVEDFKYLLTDDPLRLSVTRKKGYYLTEELPDNYFRYVRSTTTASNPYCKLKELFNYQGEESNINTILGNENMNPNFEWGETVVTLVKNKIKIYTQDKFSVIHLDLTYLRKPKEVDIQGYIKLDGTPSVNIDPELPEDVIEMCIDETARIIQGDIQNQFGNQIAQQNLQLDE